MIIIPAINCNDFKCVKEKLLKSLQFLPKNGWIQFDISDGKFTKAKSWNNPLCLKNWADKEKINLPNIEAHLMVNNPIAQIKKWQVIGVKRFIVHNEVLNEQKIKELKSFKKIEIGLAINPTTTIKDFTHNLNHFSFVQLLAVNPGYSSQKFDKKILKKIEYIKTNFPKIIIEIDGGMNEKTLTLAKSAGADIAVSGSYIFEHKNPQEIIKAFK